MSYARLLRACEVCESGAPVASFKHVMFERGSLRAFNGIIQFQAPSTFDKAERFAVSEERLAGALRSFEPDDDLSMTTSDTHLILKRKRLTVRVRKLDPDTTGINIPSFAAPNKAGRIDAPDLLAALRAVQPFVSEDATRPWSVSALLRGGEVFATNNHSLVRAKTGLPKDVVAVVPAEMVRFLCALPVIEWVCISPHDIILGGEGAGYRSPLVQAEWPEHDGLLATFFGKFPKKLPAIDPELTKATKTISKLTDQFVTLNDTTLGGKTTSIESEYELEVAGGKGTYLAKQLVLMGQLATHLDFSGWPGFIYFANERIKGVHRGAVHVER